MEDWRFLAEMLVDQYVEPQGISDSSILEAMKRIPRHLFVPENYREYAYDDSPLPIGEEQTISQPFIVARMTDLLELKKGDKVLEIGTGSGYQAALLAEMGMQVTTIERIEKLARQAGKSSRSCPTLFGVLSATAGKATRKTLLQRHYCYGRGTKNRRSLGQTT